MIGVVRQVKNINPIARSISKDKSTLRVIDLASGSRCELDVRMRAAGEQADDNSLGDRRPTDECTSGHRLRDSGGQQCRSDKDNQSSEHQICPFRPDRHRRVNRYSPEGSLTEVENSLQWPARTSSWRVRAAGIARYADARSFPFLARSTTSGRRQPISAMRPPATGSASRQSRQRRVADFRGRVNDLRAPRQAAAPNAREPCHARPGRPQPRRDRGALPQRHHAASRVVRFGRARGARFDPAVGDAVCLVAFEPASGHSPLAPFCGFSQVLEATARPPL